MIDTVIRNLVNVRYRSRAIGLHAGRCRRGLLVVAAMVVGQSTSSALADTPWPAIERFPGAEVVSAASDVAAKQRRLILGPLKKVRNALAPEREEFVRGTVRSETYFIPDERRVDAVRTWLDARLSKVGETVYSCSGRTCGSSNYWANTVFGERILYGPEQFQSYSIVLITGPLPRYVAAYVGQRGNRKIYVHVEQVSVAGASAPTFVNLLADGGLIFDDSVRQIEALREYLSADQDRRVAVVVHGGGALELEIALAGTQQRAERVRRRLVSEGVRANGLIARGIGPLAPVSGRPATRVELVALQL